MSLRPFTMACFLGLATAAFLPKAKADEWDKKTILTINEPLAIPGKVLPPGKYVMKLLESQADRHIVQVFNGDESQIQATILAIPNERLEPTDKTQFAFWETPAGQPRALRAWFYPGDNFGQEFAYPKEMATMIAQANNQSVPTVSPNNEVTQTEPGTQTQPAAPAESSTTAEPNAAPPAAPSTPAPSTDGDNMSTQNQMPADPPAADPAPSQTPVTSSNLPHTASPYPLAGLVGLLSLGAAFSARFLRKRLG